MWEIDGQPLGQVFDVRGCLKSIAMSPKERQHWAEAVDDEADAAGPPVVNGIVRLIRLDPKNLQSRTIRLQVDATRPGRRLGFV